jgi:hypothetical protein
MMGAACGHPDGAGTPHDATHGKWHRRRAARVTACWDGSAVRSDDLGAVGIYGRRGPEAIRFIVLDLLRRGGSGPRHCRMRSLSFFSGEHLLNR